MYCSIMYQENEESSPNNFIIGLIFNKVKNSNFEESKFLILITEESKFLILITEESKVLILNYLL